MHHSGRLLAAAAIVAVCWLLVARVLGPSDAWDHTQPRTMAYTVDVVVNGNWVLPAERERLKATKPPLYNWLAAPMVGLMGFSSELAHKAPSVVAFLLCWLAVVRMGRRMDDGPLDTLGWAAGLMFTANYGLFKLAYLARPDMVLTLWLTLGWMAATWLLAGTAAGDDQPAGRQRALALAFWLCLGLAALTKGPAALPLLLYALVAPPLITGRWQAQRVLGWWWGLPLACSMVGAWTVAVWRIDPEHVRRTLWATEMVGRFTGLGPEGSERGPIGLLTTASYPVVYYLVRFAPWSIISIVAMGAMWRRPGWRALGRNGAVLHGAALFVVSAVVIYTLTASKRADYVAAACGPGALLAAWWISSGPAWISKRHGWLMAATSALVLSGITALNELELKAPQRGFGDDLMAFIHEAEGYIRAEPMPIAFWSGGNTQLHAFLGYTGRGEDLDAYWLFAAREPFWLFAGRRANPPETVHSWVPELLDAGLVEACRSPRMARTSSWPEQITLYRVVPAESPDGGVLPPR
jgi:4-amino-4-deoxy-L-arabinose transferase-like glycosyltransferase